MAILNNSNAISSGGYDVNNSVRLRSSASAYLNRTPASAGNRKTFTWSGWFKKSRISAYSPLFYADAGGNTNIQIQFLDDNTLRLFQQFSGVDNFYLVTTQVFRDPSAWYHVVVAVDTTQATSSNRAKMYVNGVQVTAFSSTLYPTLNLDTTINSTVSHYVGYAPAGPYYFDGYLADVNFIDGSAKTPSDFGETDTTTGVWKPKAYSGTYGTNGFYLKFSDIATTSGSNAGLGKDFSGNGNYWTTNNISVTAGTTYDAMTDSPTNTSATVANYCVINPLRRNACTISNANLTASGPATFTKSVVASMSMPSGSGKYYWEAVFTRTSTTDGDVAVGIVSTTWNPGETAGSPSIYPGNTSDSWGVSGNSGNKINNASQTSYGSSFASGDIIMVAYDAVNGSFYVGKNGTWFNSGNPATNTNSAFTGITTEVLPGFGMAYDSGSSIVNANFGQRPFAYTPPTGFVRLNTYNLPTSTIVKGNTVMDATLYTGTGSSLAVVNAAGFKPDFVWVKDRAQAQQHLLFDSVRGVHNFLCSNNTSAESTNSTTLTSFNTNGFGLGTNATSNQSGISFVGWQWQAGQGSTSSNTSGSITSTVSVNATAGFSVVTYTGTGANATVGHGLGVAPAMVIVKRRNSTGNWNVRHVSITAANSLYLNLTNASQSDPTVWNSTVPTSTVFSIGTDTGVNASGGTYVGYCWAEIAGFSKFGSYTGNGSSDGPFVYTGFRPKFVLIKRTDTTASWELFDTSRNTYNSLNLILYPNLSDAEGVYTAGEGIDSLSNGFKLRKTGTGLNNSGGTYIYMAFAESPFSSNNRAR